MALIPEQTGEVVNAVGGGAASGGGTNVPLEQFFWDHAAALNYVAAGVLLVAGFVYLLYGYKAHKPLVTLNAAVIGGVGGLWVSRQLELGWWLIPACAAVLALLAWPLMRYSVCAMGGLAGAVLGALAWRAIALPDNLIWAGAGIGLVALGLLGLVIFRGTVIGFTSLQGAVLALAGVIALAAKWSQISGPIKANLTERPYMFPIAIVVPALIGLVYQFQRDAGSEPPTA